MPILQRKIRKKNSTASIPCCGSNRISRLLHLSNTYWRHFNELSMCHIENMLQISFRLSRNMHRRHDLLINKLWWEKTFGNIRIVQLKVYVTHRLPVKVKHICWVISALKYIWNTNGIIISIMYAISHTCGSLCEFFIIRQVIRSLCKPWFLRSNQIFVCVCVLHAKFITFWHTES